MTPPTPEAAAVLREIAVVAERMSVATDRRSELSTQRLALYNAARDAGATLRAIADAAGVSDVAVLRALQAEEKARAKAG